MSLLVLRYLHHSESLVSQSCPVDKAYFYRSTILQNHLWFPPYLNCIFNWPYGNRTNLLVMQLPFVLLQFNHCFYLLCNEPFVQLSSVLYLYNFLYHSTTSYEFFVYRVLLVLACGICPRSTYMASTTTQFIPSYFISVLREIALELNVLGIYMYLQLCSFLASLKCTHDATFRC